MEEDIGNTPGSEFQFQGTRVGYLKDIPGCSLKLFWYWTWEKSSVVRWSWVQIRIRDLLIPGPEQLSRLQLSATMARTGNEMLQGMDWGPSYLFIGEGHTHTQRGLSASMADSPLQELCLLFLLSSITSRLFSSHPSRQAMLCQNTRECSLWVRL